MTDLLAITAGAALTLPAGLAAWRLERGQAELYLVTTQRRRLIRDIVQGQAIAALPDGDARLLLVAMLDCTLVACPAEAVDIRVEPAALDARFAAEDARRNAALQARFSAQPGADAGGVAAALAAIAAAFDLKSTALAAGDWHDVPQLSRAAGMRAVPVMLANGWWADDAGPLLLRRRDGATVSAALWQRGCYRCEGIAVIASEHEPVAWRLYAPLVHDITSINGMASSILEALRHDLPAIAAAGLGTTLLGLLAPVATGWIFDDLVPAGEAGLLIATGIALCVTAVAGACLMVARGLAAARVAGRGQAAMAAGVADHVLRLPARFFRTIPAAHFNQRLEAIDRVRQLVFDLMFNAGLTLVFAIVYLGLTFVHDVRLALIGVGFTLVNALAVSMARRARARPLREAADRAAGLSGLTCEILDHIPKLRAAAAETRLLGRWTTAHALERDANARAHRIVNHVAAFGDAWQIITTMGLFAAAVLLAPADLSPGQLIAFLVAFGLYQVSVSAFVDGLMGLQSAEALAEQARPILTAPVEAAVGRADPGRLTGRIEVNQLGFGYDKLSSPIIDGLGFSVAAGEHLAIVGASGSGKSTLLRLLLGFEAPLTGSITYDGQELASLDPERVRAQIGVVLQSSRLFAGSIHDNIRGATAATFEDCLAAAEKVGLVDELASLPMGLHTVLTDGAATVSGGQRQRILIARAIAAKPRILFFDEATSALDGATQAHVARALDGLNATRISIAHRLSTVRNADRICVFDQGRFVDSGSFAELMSRSAVFAAQARRQLL